MKRSKKRLSVIDRCIRRHYPTENTGVIADMLGEDVKYIIERARQLGVHKDRRGVSDHDEYIREHYATGNVREIAEHIGYDARDVYARAKVLGLTRRRKALSCEQRCKIAKAAAQKRKIRGANQNPVTSATETLVCSAVIRGETVEDIARDTERSLEQVQGVLDRCMASGKYDAIRRSMDAGAGFYGRDYCAGWLCAGGR